MNLRYTGVAAVVTVWTSLGLASSVSSFDLLGPRPLSYLGTDPRSALLFTIGLLLPAVLLAAFHHWARAEYRLPLGFSVAMLVGLAGQAVAAVVPIGGDPGVHRVHTVSALILGASLPMLMWRFAAAQPAGACRRRSYALFWLEAVACAVGLTLSSHGVAPLAEILPGAAFHLWIFAVTFAGSPGLARSSSSRGADDHLPARHRNHVVVRLRLVGQAACLRMNALTSALEPPGGSRRRG